MKKNTLFLFALFLSSLLYAEKQIIVIHGIAAKPKQDKLEARYEKYLSESTGHQIDIDLVYWADLVGHDIVEANTDEYEEFERGEKDPNFRKYSLGKRAIHKGFSLLRPKEEEKRKRSTTRTLRFLGKIKKTRNVLRALRKLPPDNKIPGIDDVYELLFSDVRRYFRQKNGNGDPYRKLIRDRLTDKIKKNAEVCLIAHSMGSIIALDAILNKNIKIDLFLTIGSPLGIPIVQQELGVTEENENIPGAKVKRWINFNDPLDPIAIERFLSNDFTANGQKVIDIPIRNEFVVNNHGIDKKKKRNHHKSYGYLRSKKLGLEVNKFLNIY